MRTLAQAAADESIKTLLDSESNHVDVANSITAGGFPTSEAAVRRYRRNSGWKPTVARRPVAAEPDALTPILTEEDIPVRDLEAENAELRASNARMFKSIARYKNKRDDYLVTLQDAVKDAFNARTPLKATPRPKKDTRKRQDEVALWHLTDWQLGKETETYSTDIGTQRVQQYVEKAAEITEVMRADHPVNHGIVLFTGDMLEGACIFPAQEWELDADLFDQIFATADLEAYVIKEALKIYDTVEVICEWGNHGRIGRKSDGFKPSDNIDRIIYEITRRHLMTEDRITNFQLSGQFYQHFSVGNYAAIAIHGDEIKSFGGNTPSYGILRKSNAWASGVVEPFNDVYLGHYHQSMQLSMANGGSVYMTGSTESGNEYAREFVAATNSPSQRINFINPEKGFVTYESRIWLD